MSLVFTLLTVLITKLSKNSVSQNLLYFTYNSAVFRSVCSNRIYSESGLNSLQNSLNNNPLVHVLVFTLLTVLITELRKNSVSQNLLYFTYNSAVFRSVCSNRIYSESVLNSLQNCINNNPLVHVSGFHTIDSTYNQA